jgi:uncharacterized protein YjeT (DUF2065 family)
MEMLIAPQRWKHFAAMILIGDGVMALVRPRQDSAVWATGGPRSWRRLMRELEDRPTLTRAIGAAQIAAGICWALYQEKED